MGRTDTVTKRVNNSLATLYCSYTGWGEGEKVTLLLYMRQQLWASRILLSSVYDAARFCYF